MMLRQLKRADTVIIVSLASDHRLTKHEDPEGSDGIVDNGK